LLTKAGRVKEGRAWMDVCRESSPEGLFSLFDRKVMAMAEALLPKPQADRTALRTMLIDKLTDNERYVFNELSPKPLQGKEIAARISRRGLSVVIDGKEVSRLCGRPTMKKLGVKNRPKVGYFCDAN
jgi:hypothetical protein